MTEFLRKFFGRDKPAPQAPARLVDSARPGLLSAPVQAGAPLSDAQLPRVSVVILNYNGKQHLERCFKSLEEQHYPRERYEVLLIDNASSDGSIEEIQRRYGWVRLFVNDRNLGFSAGCNQGAREAKHPEVLVFLNNDMRVDARFLRELVGPVVRAEAQAASAKMFSWDGKLMNSAGGGMNFHGIGIQKAYLEAPTAEHDRPARTLFACGGAMAIDAKVFFDVGGFDEDFFAYYEDVDLGWRLWVLGHEVRYEPRAKCWHHHSSTSRTFPVETIRLLQVRNPVLACFKNYSDENLRKVLPAQLALAMRRTMLASGLSDTTAFRIEHAHPGKGGVVGSLWEKARQSAKEHHSMRREACADLVGINDLLGNWEHWMERRGQVQRRRARADEQIFALFDRPLWCIEEHTSYKELQAGLVRFMGIDAMFEGLHGAGPDPRC